MYGVVDTITQSGVKLDQVSIYCTQKKKVETLYKKNQDIMIMVYF